MNKRFEIVLVAVILFAAISVIGVIFSSFFKKNDNDLAKEIEVATEIDVEEKLITDDDSLYEKVKQYVEKERKENGYDKKQKDYKVFVYCEKFGITEQGDKKNVYVWIIEKSYYMRNDKPQISEGSSMLYKFTLKNNEVISYEIPQNGVDFATEVKKIVPEALQPKVLAYTPKIEELDKQINSYYGIAEKKEEITFEEESE